MTKTVTFNTKTQVPRSYRVQDSEILSRDKTVSQDFQSLVDGVTDFDCCLAHPSLTGKVPNDNDNASGVLRLKNVYVTASQ